MFLRLKQRFQDMRTISALCKSAEKHANADGLAEPGAEHFILAALDLPDGAAQRSFDRVGVKPEHFQHAIAQQYQDAFVTIGLAVGMSGKAGGPAPQGAYRGQTSAQELMKKLAASKLPKPLTGAHVIAVAAAAIHGTGPRALRAMRIDLEQLRRAAEAEARAVA